LPAGNWGIHGSQTLSPAPIAERLSFRNDELSRLEGIISDLINGRSRTLLINGRMGTGKSELARYALRFAGQSGQVLCLEGRFFDLHESVSTSDTPRNQDEQQPGDRPNDPLHAFRDAIRSPAPYPSPSLNRWDDLLARYTPSWLDVTRAPMQHEFLSLIENLSLRTPLVLRLEDTQYADQASVELLLQLTRCVERPEIRMLLVLEFTNEVRGSRFVTRLLQHIPKPPYHEELTVREFTEEQTKEYLQSEVPSLSPKQLSSVFQLSHGRPLALNLIVRKLTEQDHPLPTQEVDHFLATLGSPEGDFWMTFSRLCLHSLPPLQGNSFHRQILQVASVLGMRFDFDLLMTVHSRVFSAIPHSIPPALISDTAPLRARSINELEFEHELLRRFVYRSLPLDQRRTIHLQAAEVLATRRSTHTHCAELSRHYEGAGRCREAAEQLYRAAWLANKAFAHEEAEEFLCRSASLLGTPLDPSAEIEVRFLLARTLHLRGYVRSMKMGHFKKGLEDYCGSLAMWQKIREAGLGVQDLGCSVEEHLMDCLHFMGLCQNGQGRPREGIDYLAQSLAHLDCIRPAAHNERRDLFVPLGYPQGQIEARRGHILRDLALCHVKIFDSSLPEDERALTEAAKLLEKSLMIAIATGSKEGDAFCKHHLGRVRMRQSRRLSFDEGKAQESVHLRSEADALFKQAEAWYQENEHRDGFAMIQIELLGLYGASGQDANVFSGKTISAGGWRQVARRE